MPRRTRYPDAPVTAVHVNVAEFAVVDTCTFAGAAGSVRAVRATQLDEPVAVTVLTPNV